MKLLLQIRVTCVPVPVEDVMLKDVVAIGVGANAAVPNSKPEAPIIPVPEGVKVPPEPTIRALVFVPADTLLNATPMEGKSAATRSLNVGLAEPPEVGPAHT
jgi:hypothetical protein